MSKVMYAYQVIRNVNFAKDYGTIEEQLQPIVDAKISDDDLVDALKAIFEDLEGAWNISKERLEWFVYDVNDINYILFDGKNQKLKDLEIELGMTIDNMK